MISTLIAIQTVCIGVATSFVIKHFRPKMPKVKLISNTNGHKYYKTY